MWQKCPICNGTGRIPNTNYSSSVDSQCDVCHGKKIISQSNGLPPSVPQVKDHRTEPFYAPPYSPLDKKEK